MKTNTRSYRPELNKADTMREFNQAIGNAEFCYMCGDSDGMQFWRGIASQYQDDITYYVFKELNKKSRYKNQK